VAHKAGPPLCGRRFAGVDGTKLTVPVECHNFRLLVVEKK